MELDQSFPAIKDLRDRASKRLPRFVWDYLDSATGKEATLARNRAKLDEILFNPAILSGEIDVNLSTTFLGRDYALPFGIAPVGMSGMIWPGAEQALARLASSVNIPYTLSTVATRTPEEIGPLAGRNGWFQLYTPGRDEVRADILKRAHDNGFTTLVLTVDVPVSSRRERQRRAGLRMPPRMTPAMIWKMLLCPAWLTQTLQNGIPRFRTMEKYTETSRLADVTRRMAIDLHSQPDWSILDNIRTHWKGPLILKGIQNGDDARLAMDRGVDAVWVSNHGGRQIDGIPASIDMLPGIRSAVGPDFPLLFDSGIRSGLDIARALAKGANYAMLGRSFLYGIAALGPQGAQHCLNILKDDLENTMAQIGVNQISALPHSLQNEANS